LARLGEHTFLYLSLVIAQISINSSQQILPVAKHL